MRALIYAARPPPCVRHLLEREVAGGRAVLEPALQLAEDGEVGRLERREQLPHARELCAQRRALQLHRILALGLDELGHPLELLRVHVADLVAKTGRLSQQLAELADALARRGGGRRRHK